jgi:hypothetical protein
MSGLAHLPAELQESLDSGSLSHEVGAVVIFDPNGSNSSSISFSVSPSLAGPLTGSIDVLAGFGLTIFVDGIQMPN